MVASQDYPFPPNMRMESFHRGCLSAVAAAAGIAVDHVENADVFKGDAFLSVLLGGYKSLNVMAQFKSIGELTTTADGVVYDLEAKAFNVLRDPHSSSMGRALIVMELPGDPPSWSSCNHDSMTMRRRMFWAHLYGEPPTKNTSQARIKIPNDQLLNADNFVDAMKSVEGAFIAARSGDGE